MQTFKELMKEKGITQAELARRCSVSVKAVEHWREGRRIPNLKYAYYIASALGVSLEDLAIAFIYRRGDDEQRED